MDPDAFNYNPEATNNNNSCEYNEGCTDKTAINFDQFAKKDNGSCEYYIKVKGCMDPIALNYNPKANLNDNSCIYKKIISIDNENEILGRWFIVEDDIKFLLSNFNTNSGEYNILFNQIKDNTIIEIYEGYTKNINPNGKLLIYIYNPDKNITLDFKETWSIENNNLIISNNYFKPISFNNFDKTYFYFETPNKDIIRFYRLY